jgi:NAD(P)-dependent dehydrogenase (short-subunit alcohol dehydrogenase family)
LAPVGLDDTTIQNFATATLNKILLKRFGKAEEVAKLVAFLLRDDPAF